MDLELETMKSRGDLEVFNSHDLQAAWEIFDLTTQENSKELRDFFGDQASKFLDLLKETKINAVCCEKHGSSDFSLAGVIAAYLDHTGTGIESLLSLLDPRISLMRTLSAFIVGAQFGIALERAKEAAKYERDYLEKIFNPKPESPSEDK